MIRDEMTLCQYSVPVPASQIPILVILVNPYQSESESEKHDCKSHTVSAENSPYLLLSNAKVLVK